MKKDFVEQRLCDRIETEVMEVFYDYEDRYQEAYDNAMSIYENEILTNKVELNRNTHESFIIALLDISNEIKNIKTSEKVLKYAEDNIKSISKIRRVELAKAHLLALKGEYDKSIVLYEELEDHYTRLEDDVMIGVIKFHKGAYLGNTDSLIMALRKFLDIYDDTLRASERVQDTYERLLKCACSIEQLTTIKELGNEIRCLGMAI